MTRLPNKGMKLTKPGKPWSFAVLSRCSTELQHAGGRIGSCGSGSRSSTKRTGVGWPKCPNCPASWLTALLRLRLKPRCRLWPFESLLTVLNMARRVRTSSTSPSTLRDQLAEHPGATCAGGVDSARVVFEEAVRLSPRALASWLSRFRLCVP